MDGATTPVTPVETETAMPPEAPLNVPTVIPDVPVYTDVQSEFFQGYRDAGGIYEEAHIYRVIRCESNWNQYSQGAHLGLAQFNPGTWATISADTGLTDWTDPYSQGANMATWAMRFENPGATQWPWCWWS